MEITKEAKNKIIHMRELLKQNAPLIYKKFANSKIYGNKEEEPKETKVEPKNGLDEETLAGAKRFQDWMDEEEVRMKNTI